MNFNQIDSLECLCLIWPMSNKGFTETNTNIETPNNVSASEKPLNIEPIYTNRVDINVLKAKLQQTESKEFKKNIYILSALSLGLGTLGIYLSL